MGFAAQRLAQAVWRCFARSSLFLDRCRFLLDRGGTVAAGAERTGFAGWQLLSAPQSGRLSAGVFRAVSSGLRIRRRTLDGPLSHGRTGGSCPRLSPALGHRCDILRGWPDSGTCCLPRCIEGLDEVPRREAAPVSAAADSGRYVGRGALICRFERARERPKLTTPASRALGATELPPTRSSQYWLAVTWSRICPPNTPSLAHYRQAVKLTSGR